MILVQYALHCKLNVTNITAAELSSITSKVGEWPKPWAKNMMAATINTARFRYLYTYPA